MRQRKGVSPLALLGLTLMTAAVSVTSVGASGIQSSAQAGSNASHDARKVKFSSQTVYEARVKEKLSPTYSRLQWSGILPTPKDPDPKEGIRIDEALARKRATTLAESMKKSLGPASSNTSCCQTVKIGCDFTGLASPIQAFKNLGVHAKHSFCTESEN